MIAGLRAPPRNRHDTLPAPQHAGNQNAIKLMPMPLLSLRTLGLVGLSSHIEHSEHRKHPARYGRARERIVHAGA
jgi:hypothetical protein